mmetsp:Transcript_26120/g.55866  ORF Transcript_26120/g.55866 Transcript_26120/m.55866 type:complete len:177 (-) Transcript_26120:46-576(-)
MQLQRSLAAGRRGLSRHPASRPSRGGVPLGAVRKGGEKNVVCTKTVLAKAEHAAKVKELCAKYEEDMKANQAGILAFECTEDNFDENAVHFWERYKNSAYFNQGMQSKETTAFLKEVAEYVEKPVGIALFEYANGQIGNACVEIGPKGEGGLDDATGANKYGGGARYEQTSNTVQL